MGINTKDTTRKNPMRYSQSRAGNFKHDFHGREVNHGSKRPSQAVDEAIPLRIGIAPNMLHSAACRALSNLSGGAAEFIEMNEVEQQIGLAVGWIHIGMITSPAEDQSSDVVSFEMLVEAIKDFAGAKAKPKTSNAWPRNHGWTDCAIDAEHLDWNTSSLSNGQPWFKLAN